MACFRSNTAGNFIFLLKYLQRKIDINVNKKSLVFVSIRHFFTKFNLYVQLSYTKISYLCKNTRVRKDAASLHFRLKKSSENMIFPWNGNIQKLTKKWSFLSFLQISVRRKLLFSCSAGHYWLTVCNRNDYLRLVWSDLKIRKKLRRWSIYWQIWNLLTKQSQQILKLCIHEKEERYGPYKQHNAIS